jgi:predicted MFS family arabinose efflux permease
MSFLALTAAIAIVLSGGWAQTLAALLLVFAALGVAKGLLGAVAFAALGETDNPDRAFGASVVGQSLLAAVAAVPLSAWIVPRYGVVGLFCALAALLCAGFAACVWMPVQGRTAASATAGSGQASPLVSAAAVPPFVALLASGLFAAGIMGFWYFMERIGTARGSSAGWVGLAVSLAALASIVTAAVVTWLGARWSSLVYVFGGTALVLAAFALLSLPGDAAFMSACLLFALGWGLAQPAYWAVVRKVDATNRLFATAPAASSAGAVVVGLAAGPLIAQGGYGELVACSAAFIAAGAICLVLSDKLLGRALQAAPAT